MKRFEIQPLRQHDYHFKKNHVKQIISVFNSYHLNLKYQTIIETEYELIVYSSIQTANDLMITPKEVLNIMNNVIEFPPELGFILYDREGNIRYYSEGQMDLRNNKITSNYKIYTVNKG